MYINITVEECLPGQTLSKATSDSKALTCQCDRMRESRILTCKSDQMIILKVHVQ